MNKKSIGISLFLLVLIGVGIKLLVPTPAAGTAPMLYAQSISHKEDPSRPSKPLTADEAAAAKTSLEKMTQVLAVFSVQGKSFKELIANLQQDQQEPVQIRDKNPDTGEMIIVRTKSPPSGTRYFHAQYFVDEHNQPFAQHISFEFRPSPEAMEQAIEMVYKTFPLLTAPSEEGRDFIQWDLPDGYVVWVKRLQQQDIVGNPFNAYTPGDIGSIRAAVELNPEGHDH